MDNITIKKTTFRWLILAASIIVISLLVLLRPPSKPALAQGNLGWHIKTFEDSSNVSTTRCEEGENMGGFYLDINNEVNIGITIHEHHYWMGFYNPPTTPRRYVVLTGAATNSLNWGTVYSFDDICLDHGVCYDQGMVNWIEAIDTYNLIGYPGGVACYGEMPTATPTVTPTATPPPDPEICTPEGQNVTVDLVPGGYVTGSLSAYPYDYTNQYDLIDVIRFDISSVIPLTFGEIGQDHPGFLSFELAGANILYIDSWINDTFVPNSPASLKFPIPVEGGQTTHTVSYTGYVHRSYGDQNPGDTPRITAINLEYTAANDSTQLICDGGMKMSTSDTPWQRTNDEQFGRGWMDWFDLFNGAPACDPGQQSIAHQGYTGVGSLGQFSPVRQAFTMPIGSSTLNYKFRYRSRPEASWLSLYGGSPNVYITDNAGNVIADLIGTVNYDPGLVITDWTKITGSLSLSPGKYAVVLNQGYKWSGGSIDIEGSGQLYYDDVQLSTGALDTGCSDWTYTPPELLPTATPTLSPTPTMTGTVATPTPTVYLIGTSSATSTLRSTPTLRNTPSPSGTALPSGTPTSIGTSTPRPSSTSIFWQTPSPAPGTPTTVWQPGNAWDWPRDWDNPNPPTDGSGNYPGTGPGNGGWTVTCLKPDHWYQISWWIDYERCLIMAAVAWGPSQSATMVAIPGMMSSREPITSVNQIGQGLRSMQTQAAAYDWEDTGMSGVNANVTPDPRFIFAQSLSLPGPVQVGPWDIGGRINFGGTPSQSAFSKVCNTNLSNMMASRLAEGLCFALNITKSIGYLGWIQFLTNGLILFAIVRLCLGAIRYYSFFPTAGPMSDGQKKEYLKDG
jgi:hypothetical protein